MDLFYFFSSYIYYLNLNLLEWLLYQDTSVMRVGSDTFGDLIFQKGLQN